MKQLGLQLYTIRDYMNTSSEMDAALEKVRAFGYTEAHTAGNAIPYEEFGALLKKHGIRVIGTHYSFDKIMEEIEDTMRVHEAWGTVNVGIGGMPGWAREGYEPLMRFIDQYNVAAKEYAKRGFKLTYHNHSFEFVRVKEEKTMMDLLYENLDPENISFVLDTCWVAHAGADVRYWMEKLKGRIDILHLKDHKMLSQQEFALAEIGNGNLWWDGIMETAEKIGVRHYVVEQDSDWINNSPFDAVKASSEYLKKYIK